MPSHCLRIARIIFLASPLSFAATPASPQTTGTGNQLDERQQQIQQFITGVKVKTQKTEDFFTMLKEGEQKKRELAEQNQENVRQSQEKAREAKEATRRLQEETHRKAEEARVRQKEQLRMMQDRMRR